MNNSRCILGAILIIILVLGFINNTNFSQIYKEPFLVGNTGFDITEINNPNPLADDDDDKERPLCDRIVYKGASTPFTPVGTVLSNNTGEFVCE